MADAEKPKVSRQILIAFKTDAQWKISEQKEKLKKNCYFNQYC